MRYACCDWALIHGYPAGDRAPNAKTCPRHLRGRTHHVRPSVPERFARARQRLQDDLTSAEWARWAAGSRGMVR